MLRRVGLLRWRLIIRLFAWSQAFTARPRADGGRTRLKVTYQGGVRVWLSVNYDRKGGTVARFQFQQSKVTNVQRLSKQIVSKAVVESPRRARDRDTGRRLGREWTAQAQSVARYNYDMYGGTDVRAQDVAL